MTADGYRKGRNEDALNREFGDHPRIGLVERTALRSQARALDVAEAAGDADRVSRVNAVYLDLRRAAGLVAGARVDAGDSFAELMAELGRPTTPVGHPEKP